MVLLLALSCAIGGQPATPASDAEAARRHVSAAGEHARQVIARAGEARALAEGLSTADEARLREISALVAELRREEEALQAELAAARAKLHARTPGALRP